MQNGFIKVAAATPNVRVADCLFNQREISEITRSAHEGGVKIIVFPELSLTSYSCGDLFHSTSIVKSAKDALLLHLQETADIDIVSIVGLPVMHGGKLYDCAAVCQSGMVLGFVPKNVLPDFSEFAESRIFASAPEYCDFMDFGEFSVPFGAKLIFTCNRIPELKFGIETGSDIFAPCPPSTDLAAAGATIIFNPMALPETITRSDFVNKCVTLQSQKSVCAYVCANCGDGESTTDSVFAGHSLIAENGNILAERKSFVKDDKFYIESEIDLELIMHDRISSNIFRNIDSNSFLPSAFDISEEETKLTRKISAHPFIPKDEKELANRCASILHIQAHGLKKRIECAYAKKCVVGISGGLDSCLALLVCAEAMDLLNRPRTDIIGVTMPCFGTTKRTKSNAEILCNELGTSFRTVDITDSVNIHFSDINHNPDNRNVVYENAQARERTQVIMDIANEENGIVIGTGDLSELALGWATYNGDQMSMYGVNASVPKTLIKHIVDTEAKKYAEKGMITLSEVLLDILATPVSPELLPADKNGNIAQKTENLVGPYELHDFYLYYMLRYGFSPSKLFRIAKYALGDKYNDCELLKWLENFVKRFISQQFKRSCLPDGPSVSTVSLSPRAGFKMPSDACSSVWMKDIEQLKKIYG